MTEEERQSILLRSKVFFRTRVSTKHVLNTSKLADIAEFNINPFTHKYLSFFAFGNDDPINMAKVLLYPRMLGTSISTTFGKELQNFCNDVLSSYASVVPGIDIEFLDSVDGRKKYCQLKSGPETINSEDVTTVKDHFIGIKNLARTNRLLNFNPLYDCVVGVFYGEHSELSNNYKKIEEEYPVYSGEEFWYHLTGDVEFYYELIAAFAEVAVEVNSTILIEDVLTALSDNF